MVVRARDDRTSDLFQIPAPKSSSAQMDYRAEVSRLVSDLLAGAPGDREAIAERMSRLSGRLISKAMLDGYSSTARDTFNIPLALAPVIEVASRSRILSDWHARVHGGRILFGAEALGGDLARLERLRTDTNRRIRSIRKLMGVNR